MKISAYPDGVPSLGDKFIFERTDGTVGDFKADAALLSAQLALAGPAAVGGVVFTDNAATGSPAETIFTVPATLGSNLWRLGLLAVTTTPATAGTATVTVSWTCEAGTSQSAAIALNLAAAGNQANFSELISLGAGTAVTFSVVLAGVTGGPPVYAARVSIEKII